MDVSLVIKQRLSELGLDQRDLAAATQVTESYVSQLLTRRRAPPAPGRTDIYEKMGEFLKLPAGELSRLAEIQRREEVKKRVTAPSSPLFQEFRELILCKCEPARQKEIRRIFEKEPFGELERLITQTLLDAAQGVAREELRSEEWLRVMAQISGRSYEEIRVSVLEFLDTDVFDVSLDNCVSVLDPMIESWDIDLKTFGIELALNRRLARGGLKRFEFVETEPHPPVSLEPGFEQFLKDKSMSGSATEAEIEFLKRLNFNGRRPSPLYYYRALQDLRDPLHFSRAAQSKEQPRTG